MAAKATRPGGYFHVQYPTDCTLREDRRPESIEFDLFSFEMGRLHRLVVNSGGIINIYWLREGIEIESFPAIETVT